VLCGWLHKEANSLFAKAQLRWCEVRGGSLRYSHQEGDAKPKECIPLAPPTEISLDKGKGGHVLVVATRTRKWRFRHADKEVVFRWLQETTRQAGGS